MKPPRLALGLTAGLMSMVFACGPDQKPAKIPVGTPGLELSTIDYPTVRARFVTRLLRHGPSSQVDQLPETPAGSVVVHYPSGRLTLGAYASPILAGGTKKPGLLFLHGGFEFGEGHWAMTEPFRDAGYVVMIPTLRGENGQSGDFSLFYDEVDDVLAAADALANRTDVDQTRLYLAGHSVGGTLTLLAALSSSRFRAVASFSGSPDQVEFTRGRPERIPFDPSVVEEFRVRSPVAFAKHFQSPVRLYFGEEEYWLQASTRRLVLLAQQAGLDVEAVEVVGGHETANPKVIQACLKFFRSH